MTATSVQEPACPAGAPPQRPRPPRPGVYRWTRDVYEQAVEAGVFDPRGDELVGARVELLDGEIINMPPQSPHHVTAIQLAAQALQRALGSSGISGVHLRNQGSLALDDYSEPEPDLAIVRGGLRDFTQAHPNTALLVVEVSRATLRYDRTRKAAAYARNGVAEYWIINLRERVVEVLREPTDGVYRERAVVGAAERVQSSALPGLWVAVADLLP